MSQNDEKRDPQDQEEGFQDQGSDRSRESRSDSLPSDSALPRQDRSPDLDDADDDMDDDDRDEDSRIVGGVNRRNSIG